MSAGHAGVDEKAVRQHLNELHRLNMADPVYAKKYWADIKAKAQREGPSSGRQSHKVDFDSPLYPSKK